MNVPGILEYSLCTSLRGKTEGRLSLDAVYIKYDSFSWGCSSRKTYHRIEVISPDLPEDTSMCKVELNKVSIVQCLASLTIGSWETVRALIFASVLPPTAEAKRDQFDPKDTSSVIM